MPADRDCAPLRALPERPRVLALEWNLPFHIDVAACLAECHGWNFVYWVGDGPVFGGAVEARFPGIVFHDTVDARYGRPPAAMACLVPCPFDEEMALTLAYEETLALKMMDRIELEESFSYHERVRLYHRLVSWWSALLDHIKPDVMMIPTAPHVHYDYVVYALCRRRGIRTAMFENGSIPGVLLPAPIFEDGFPDLLAAYQCSIAADDGSGEVTLSPRAAQYLASTRGTYVVPYQWMPFRKAYTSEPEGDGVTRRSLPRIWSLLSKFSMLKKIVHVSRYPAYFAKLRGEHRLKKLPSGARRISGHYHGRFLVVGEAIDDEDARHAQWVSRRMADLRSEYDRNATPVDLSANYVYVPLHVQPERSTSPNGGIYDHAELVIDAIACSVPPGWLVYVKEHPFQFAPWQTGERGRRLSDYAAMAAKPNVRLVPFDTKAFDLIDRGRAVATVTGTSGWEAIARGVPVLCFGIAWYQGCDGVFDVRRIADLPLALQAIADGARPNQRCLRHFLNAVEAVGLHAFIDEEARAISQLSNDENIVALADGLAGMVAQGTRR